MNMLKVGFLTTGRILAFLLLLICELTALKASAQDITENKDTKTWRLGVGIGPQYSLLAGTSPNLIQSNVIPIGFGVFANWYLFDPNSIEFSLNTIDRSARTNFLTNPIAQTSYQFQLLYRHQVFSTLNIGLGGHIDYNPTTLGWVNVPIDGSLPNGFTEQEQNKLNYGITASIKYEPNLKFGMFSPFLDLRYLYSFKNISEGTWNNVALDTKVSQIQMFLGVTFP